MKKVLFFLVLGLVCLGCEKSGDSRIPSDGFTPKKNASLFVVNEGNFGVDNASLSYYDLSTGKLEEDIFSSENDGQKLGDTAQSMAISGDCAWIVVNNSNCLIRTALEGFKVSGRIDDLDSPRYFCPVSDTKAYLSQMGSGNILIVNPSACEVTGQIETGESSTEQILKAGNMVYVNCWSFGSKVLKINSTSDKLHAALEVGQQPNSMALDKNGKLWVLTDGGWNPDWTSHAENPALHMIDTMTFEVVRKVELPITSNVSDLSIDKDGDTLYYLDDKGVFSMEIDSESAPETPFIAASEGRKFYAMSVSPSSSDIAVSEVSTADYSGKTVYIYSSAGEEKTSFEAGICPGDFCWY